jgi:predicted enzyme related to lactoylglutathione lyase
MHHRHPPRTPAAFLLSETELHYLLLWVWHFHAIGKGKLMAVLRIVTNLHAEDPHSAASFYERLLGLKIVMDHGWLLTYASESQMRPQLGIASEGGSGTPVPDLSIEVDNVDEIYARAQAEGLEILYPLTNEPWQVRRFYVRDPLGKVVNILMHFA